MGYYQKRPVVVEAISFEELMEHGLAQCRIEGRQSSIINGKPWSFTYKGHPISHETDDCYIVPSLENPNGHHMTPNDVLITGTHGEIYPCKKHIFEDNYTEVTIGGPTS